MLVRNGQLTGVGAVVIALFVIALLCLPFSCRTVDGGFIGVKKTFGAIHSEPLKEGPHLLIPFVQRITSLNTKLQSFQTEEASAASKDLQVVTTKISVQHWLNPDMAPEASREVGGLEEFDRAVVEPAVLESLKAVTAQYTAEELVTKRELVKSQIENAIKTFIAHTLTEKKIAGALGIANVAIKDFQFSKEYNDAIESKVTAQQTVLTAQSTKARRTTDAEAGLAEAKAKTDAEVYKIEQESTKRAAAIEREAKALAGNPMLIQLRAVERWDGTVPHYVGTGSAVPFINIDAQNQTAQTQTVWRVTP